MSGEGACFTLMCAVSAKVGTLVSQIYSGSTRKIHITMHQGKQGSDFREFPSIAFEQRRPRTFVAFGIRKRKMHSRTKYLRAKYLGLNSCGFQRPLVLWHEGIEESKAMGERRKPMCGGRVSITVSFTFRSAPGHGAIPI